ncbi:hypothetical protein Tco_0328187, partial [Tanacetum coccineum]
MTLNSGATLGFRLPEVSRRSCEFRLSCCCSDNKNNSRRIGVTSAGGRKADNVEEWKTDLRKSSNVRVRAAPAWRFASSQPQLASKQEKFSPRCTPKNIGPQSHDTPPKRASPFIWYEFLPVNNFILLTFLMLDTGIANEKDWGINLLTEHVNEAGINEDG